MKPFPKSRRQLLSFLTSWQDNLRIIVRLTALLRPYWLQTWGTILCLLFSTALSMIIPWLLAWVVDVGIQQRQANGLLLAAGAVLLASILRGLFAYGQGYLSQAVASLTARDLRDIMYEHIQQLSFSFHDESETGQLMSRLTVDIDAVRNFFPRALLRAVLAVCTFVPVTIILFWLDWRLALLTLISVPVFLFLAVQVAQQLSPIWTDVQNETGQLGTIMQESLSGVRVVKSFAREDFEVMRYDEQNRLLRELNLNAMRLSAKNQPLLVMVLNVVTVLVIWVGGGIVINHHLSLGTLVAVTQYVLLLGTPVRMFAFMVTWFMRAISGGLRIFSILDTEPTITDRANAHELQDIQGHVCFNNVSFSYIEGREVLHDICIDAKPGQMIALLGATGSGKTTLLHLLPRFYDVDTGSITIDGQDIRDVTLSSLRQNIGLVFQDVFLFNATLRDNLAYGAGEVSDEQIIAAAKAARVDDFARNLPEGYNTWVGERGVTLSGGQKQRVAIARTLLLDPRILILDDATSSVDMETEYLIQQALDRVMHGRTTFVIASRLRTIKQANQILILQDGAIVERGTHKTLLAQNGLYRQLYDLQLREQEEFEERLQQEQQEYEKRHPEQRTEEKREALS